MEQRRPAAELQRPYNWRRVEKGRWGCSPAGIAVLLVGVIILLSIGAVAYGEYEIHAPQNSATGPFGFVVLPGDTYGRIADRLKKRGILHNSFLFSIDARVQGLGSKLRVGTYTLRPNMSIDQIVATLANGHAKSVAVTIPPGWRATQMAARLSAYGISSRAFLRAVRSNGRVIAADYGLNVRSLSRHSLEGFLFPDTYNVDPGTSGASFAATMVRQFAHEFGPRMRAHIRRSHRSMYKVVSIASIVEREARVPSERRIIAGVYYNRLRAHMFLDADPTIQYALGTPANWWPLLSVADYHSVHSPYNTYLHTGLPPGPIASPSWASLRAAVYPAHTGYYYFVACGSTGHHVFARTYAQQQANIARCR